ncbi:hypothetical protein [Pseudoxanthomonas sp.]|nr:hypothetical protein [Pseudoxanthomonas sp.]WDS36214.1 MAG: hypothetical protein O8I58_18415 [Pseudoxanthomonas sp.]
MSKPTPKPHPWRVHSPGWLANDRNRNEKTVPAHARPVRKG